MPLTRWEWGGGGVGIKGPDPASPQCLSVEPGGIAVREGGGGEGVWALVPLGTNG